jgi:GR25 family glycosyltransferase involved in LPS biosynthesis
MIKNIINNLSHYGDILAIPFFGLLVSHFYNIENKTDIEYILFLFSISALLLDSLFVYMFLYDIKSSKKYIIYFLLIIFILSVLWNENKNNKKEYFSNKMINDHINDHIDVIYYINLDKRKDRKKNFLEEMNKIGIDSNKIVRIPAIYMPQQGDLGCSKSHVKTLETFIESPYKNCIIFEDDFEFTLNKEEVNNIINNFFENNINYDILMLSSNDIVTPENTEHNFLKKTLNSQTASGYIVNKNFAKILLNNFKNSAELLEKNYEDKNYCVDQYWKSLQPDSNWYTFHPKLGKQRQSYSDIEKKMVDYNV